MPTFKSGLYDDIPGRDYHADIWGEEIPTFSRSIAHKIYSESPLAAWASHPRLGGYGYGESDDEETQERDSEDSEYGSIYHELLLGGSSRICPLPHNDFRTKKAREERDAALASGLIPISEPKWQGIRTVSDKMRNSVLAAGIPLADCEKEQTVLWASDDIRCKCRVDLLLGRSLQDEERAASRLSILDLKIRKELNLPGFLANISRFGLDIQAFSYTEGLTEVFPKTSGRVDFYYLLAQKIRPYDVAIIPASKALLSMGEMKWRVAREIWRRCLESGKWPGIGRAEPAQPQPWQLAEAMRRFTDEFGEENMPADFVEKG